MTGDESDRSGDQVGVGELELEFSNCSMDN